MRRSDAAPVSPVQGPCTAGDGGWQEAVATLSRAAGRYGALLAAAGGDRAEAASRLWLRSRDDAALRDDLARAACALLALAPGGGETTRPASKPAGRRRPGRLSRFDLDPEVAAFVRERLGTMPVVRIADAALARFGPDRAPRKTAICRYWHRLEEGRRET